MNPLKQLFGQTAVYGIGTVVPRLLNYLLLTPFFTRIFEKSEYGVVTELYAYVVFLMIIMTYGMETAFFRFAQKSDKADEVFSTSIISLLISSGSFMLIVWILGGEIADAIGYKAHPEYILWIGVIVGIDALSTIPFARLRWKNRALKFAMIKIIGVVINIVLNFSLLYFIPGMGESMPEWLERIYDYEIGVGYVFISNMAASAITLVMLSGTLSGIKITFHVRLWKKMIAYAYPLLISGLAGTVNEALDRVLLKHLIPDELNAIEQLGIYGANYKIAVLMTLFIQMFRYASDPFYFGQAERKDAMQLFASIMKYFVLAGILIFLIVTLYLDVFKYFIGKNFHEGLHIVPVVLFANLLLGIFFNLSVWYKLKNMTRYGAGITLAGAGITFMMNWFLIPVFGYIAAAWAHVACYAGMVILSWMMGRKYYPVPYPIPRILFYMALALGLYGISKIGFTEDSMIDLLKNTIIFAVFVIIVFFMEWKNVKRMMIDQQS